jgi:hypothetical protein
MPALQMRTLMFHVPAGCRRSRRLDAHVDVSRAGRMPALQTLGAHADVSRAGKMPALQTFGAHADVSRAGKMPALQ